MIDMSDRTSGLLYITAMLLLSLAFQYQMKVLAADIGPVLSRAGASWQGRRGYVQDAVLQDHADMSEHSIYLCGSPSMISAARIGCRWP